MKQRTDRASEIVLKAYIWSKWYSKWILNVPAYTFMLEVQTPLRPVPSLVSYFRPEEATRLGLSQGKGYVRQIVSMFGGTFKIIWWSVENVVCPVGRQY